MPLSVREVFAGAGLEPVGVVRWGESIPAPAANETGVYIVALAQDPHSLQGALEHCPVDRSAVDELLSVCARLTVDGEPTTGEALTKRLAAFWLRDEVVLYIGLAGQPLRTRVRQYYKTPLGASRPHKGGWWLKTLAVLPDLWVHYAPTSSVAGAEQDALAAFAKGVSEEARAALHGSERLMPFANLEHPPGTRKAHGIRGATATDGASPKQAEPAAGTSSPSRRPTTTAGSDAGRTQRVTAKDIEAGRIRIPLDGTKRLFPRDKADIELALRGTNLVARWDPRYGPDKERSGVLGIGRGRLHGVVESDEILRVTTASARIRLD